MLKKIFYLIKDHKRKFILSLLLFFVASIFDLIGIGLIYPYIQVIEEPGIIANYIPIEKLNTFILSFTNYQIVLFISILLVVMYGIKSFITFKAQRAIQYYIYLITHNVKMKLYSAYLKADYEYHLENNSARLISKISGEVQNFTHSVLQSFLFALYDLFFLVALIIVIIITTPTLLLVVGALVFFFALFYRFTKNKTLEYGRIGTYANMDLTSYVNQGLRSTKIIKLNGVQNYFIKNAANTSEKIVHSSTSFYSFMILPKIALELLLIISLVGFVLFTILKNQGVGVLQSLTPLLATIAVASFRVIPSINRLINSVSKIKHGEACVNVVYEDMYNIEQDIEAKNFHIKKSDIYFENKIELRNVSFKYKNSDEYALHNVNLGIAKGQSIGIMGPSGAGKSTLVDIILGLLYPCNGDILVDGKSIYEDIKGWQNRLSYVPQMIYLLDDTIRKNIAFGVEEDDIDEKRLERVIEAAELKNFIDALPEGARTMIGENGVRLSGGQRQRLGIARALYKGAEILMFDEATSSLDNETEKIVTDAIDSLSGTKTMIIIAHRLTTLFGCDLIYKLDDGEVVEYGSYKEMVLKE